MILILQPSKGRGEGAYNSVTLGELNIVKIPETFLLRLHVSNTWPSHKPYLMVPSLHHTQSNVWGNDYEDFSASGV